MTAALLQPIAGLAPPALSEVRIREVYPSVARSGAIASLGQKLNNTIILAPLGWLVMSWVYFSKLLPFFMVRYMLTNRAIKILKGWKATVAGEVKLADIDDVILIEDSNSTFFRSGNLEIKSGGKTVLTLAGVCDPESFRQTILIARNAWAPGRVKSLPFISAAATN